MSDTPETKTGEQLDPIKDLQRRIRETSEPLTDYFHEAYEADKPPAEAFTKVGQMAGELVYDKLTQAEQREAFCQILSAMVAEQYLKAREKHIAQLAIKQALESMGGKTPEKEEDKNV